MNKSIKVALKNEKEAQKMNENILFFKVSRILGVNENRVKWDMTLQEQVEKLVEFIELIADKVDVDLYE